jgi:hypothetical protein
MNSNQKNSMLERGVVMIAWSTLLTGIAQMLKPGVVMRVIGAKDTSTGRHLFATVGMFMSVIGGQLLQTILFERKASRVVLGWATAQKFGASIAVAVGVARGIFSPLALAVAGFDFLSGIVFALRRGGEEPASPYGPDQ